MKHSLVAAPTRHSFGSNNSGGRSFAPRVQDLAAEILADHTR